MPAKTSSEPSQEAVSISASEAHNLANLHPVVDYNNTICPSLVTTPACSQTGGERLLREYTWRPRTIGMTFIFRK